MKNINYYPKTKMSPWRKISLASWKPTGDSACYCFEEIIADPLLDYCKTNSINLHSFIIKAFSNAIHKEPTINSTIRWGKLYRRKPISVFFHTILNSRKDDLSGIVIEEGQDKKMMDLDEEYSVKVKDSKEGLNDFTESKKITNATPSFFTKPILNLYSFISYTLNLNLALFKSKKNSFGSVMITSIGSLGISRAFCPIAPYTKVPMVASVGKIEEKPVVINQEIKIKKVISLGFTFDHRIMDRLHFSEFFKVLNSYFINPKSIDNV